MMKIIKGPNGKWQIIDDSGAVIGEYATNSQAWRALDRINREPISKREDSVDWAWRQRLDQ